MSDDKLRELYTLGLSTGPGRPTANGAHLEADDWERMSLGHMSAAERRRAVDHIGRCSECARIFKTLSTLEDQAREIDPRVSEPGLAASPDRARVSFAWPALAAAAALVLLVALPSRAPRDASDPVPPEPALRSGSEASRPLPLAPIGTVPRTPSALTWQGVPGISSYRVELLSRDGELLWEGETDEETSIELPHGTAEAPGRYFWRVVAIPTPGARTSTAVTSEMVAFELQPTDG